MPNIKRIEIEYWMKLELTKSPRCSNECGLKAIDHLPLEFGCHRPSDGVYLRHDWMDREGYSLWNIWSNNQIRNKQRRAKYMGTRLYLAIVVYGNQQYACTLERDFQPIEQCPRDFELDACLVARRRLTARDRRWLDYWMMEKSRLSSRLQSWKTKKEIFGVEGAKDLRKQLDRLPLP